MKIFKEVKTIQKVMCNLKEYHNLRFLVSIIDREEKKRIISCSILFIFYGFSKIFYVFLLFFKIDENNFYLFSKDCYEFHFIFKNYF